MIHIYARRRPSFGVIGQPNPITLDASLREDHGVHNVRTDHPVAFGALITDHVLTLPDAVTIEGIVTASPDDFAYHEDFVTAPSSTRHHKSWKRFTELARSRVPFDVVTTLAIYTNMIVDDLETTRSPGDGLSIVISVRCSKIEVASVDVSQELADAALEAGLAEVDLGMQGTGPM